MKKNKIFLTWLLFSSFAIFTFDYFLFFQILLPLQVKQIREDMFERLTRATRGKASYLIQSIQSGDDIAIIKILKETAADPDFTYARLVMPDGTILSHNSISNNDAHSNAHSNINFSLPLLSSGKNIACFKTGMSVAGMNKRIKSLNKFFWVLTAGFCAVQTAAFAALFIFIVLSRLREFKSSMENILTGSKSERMPCAVEDEIGSLAKILNQILDKTCRR